MKKKFSRVLGVGLTVALLASLMLVAAPVSAGTLKWTSETIPSTTGKVLQPGIDILDLAVAGDEETIYAVGGGVASLPVVDDNRHWCGTDYCPDSPDSQN